MVGGAPAQPRRKIREDSSVTSRGPGTLEPRRFRAQGAVRAAVLVGAVAGGSSRLAGLGGSHWTGVERQRAAPSEDGGGESRGRKGFAPDATWATSGPHADTKPRELDDAQRQPCRSRSRRSGGVSRTNAHHGSPATCRGMLFRPSHRPLPCGDGSPARVLGHAGAACGLTDRPPRHLTDRAESPGVGDWTLTAGHGHGHGGPPWPFP